MSYTTKLKSPIKCDFCKSDLSEVHYKPVGTLRGWGIGVCPGCGLVQSVKISDEFIPQGKTLSCDADWGNVRHGKSARLAAFTTQFADKVPWDNNQNILDVGSNRGSFIKWILNIKPSANILAIEPDGSIVAPYADLKQVKLIQDRFENVDVDHGKYDFIYCSHTLEHASSASEMLLKIQAAAREGAYLFLEVPNIESIGDKFTVEEFFIDKHTFHFAPDVLLEYVHHIGFEIVSRKIDLFNISLLLRKKPQTYIAKNFNYRSSNVNQQVSLISRYSQTLSNNRKLLKKVVDEKLKPLAARQKVGYWGAGRIFDALVKYGGLSKSDVFLLVDGFLAGIVKQTHGVTIRNFFYIKKYTPQVMVILARSSANELKKKAYSMGIRHVVTFQTLLNQYLDI